MEFIGFGPPLRMRWRRIYIGIPHPPQSWRNPVNGIDINHVSTLLHLLYQQFNALSQPVWSQIWSAVSKSRLARASWRFLNQVFNSATKTSSTKTIPKFLTYLKELAWHFHHSSLSWSIWPFQRSTVIPLAALKSSSIAAAKLIFKVLWTLKNIHVSCKMDVFVSNT